MKLKGVDIYVYKLDDNGTFDAIGQINKFTSLMWPDKFDGCGSFELNAPLTPENKELLKRGNILWCGGDNAAIIEIIKVDKKENGQVTYNVKGRTLEMLLSTRIIWGTYHAVNKYTSTIMYEIVNSQCVNPSNSNRKIPFLECAADEKLGKVKSFQKSQKSDTDVYDALLDVGVEDDIGFDILFRPREKKLIFKVTQGVDRSTSDGTNSGGIVIFSTDLEDILSSSYYTNGQDMKNVALVLGEGEGEERKRVTVGNTSSKGFARKELYVDARDIQSLVENDIGVWTTLSASEYNSMLSDRGVQKLAEHAETESFEAQMRVMGSAQYIYGIDYNKGDTVIIRDTDIGVQIIAKITEVSENFDDEYELLLTFGYSYPTLIEKIKKRIS